MRVSTLKGFAVLAGAAQDEEEGEGEGEGEDDGVGIIKV